jgi:hypothetical protein
LTKTAAVERAQFNTALEQPLELFPGTWRAWVLRPWWRCLMPRALWLSVISQSLLFKLSRH